MDDRFEYRRRCHTGIERRHRRSTGAEYELNHTGQCERDMIPSVTRSVLDTKRTEKAAYFLKNSSSEEQLLKYFKLLKDASINFILTW